MDQWNSGKPGELVSYKAFTSYMVTKMVDQYFCSTATFILCFKALFSLLKFSIRACSLALNYQALVAFQKGKSKSQMPLSRFTTNPKTNERHILPSTNPSANGGGHGHQQQSIHLDRLSINRQQLNVPGFKHYIQFYSYSKMQSC